MCHSQIPISKHVSFSMLLWHGFAMVAASLYYLVGQRGSGSLPQCAWVVYGPDGVSADRRGIEPDFSMGRNRPSASWRGRRRGHVGNVGEGQPIWAKRGEGTCGEFAHQGLRWERLFRGGVGSCEH